MSGCGGGEYCTYRENWSTMAGKRKEKHGMGNCGREKGRKSTLFKQEKNIFSSRGRGKRVKYIPAIGHIVYRADTEEEHR
jgi:hypothetical protein